MFGFSYDNLFSSSDRLTLSYSEPLRVRSGSVEYGGTLDASYTAQNGNRVSLSPSGKERNLELSYVLNTSLHTRIGLGMAYILDPSHNADARNAMAFGFKLNHTF